MKFNSFYIIIPVLIGVLMMTGPVKAQAQSLFTVTPTKIEMSIKPGQSRTEKIEVFNNSNQTKTFHIDVQDFSASDDQDEDIIVGFKENNPLSLFRHVYTNRREFTLQSGEKTTVDVIVDLPENMSPGSKHAVFLISSVDSENTQAAAKTVSQIGVLLFVRVEGQEIWSGRLVNAGILGGTVLFTQKTPVVFVSYENKGNTYLNPYGYIEVKNVVTNKVIKEPIAPWFVLPTSYRIKETPLPTLAGGLYTVKIFMNRGYDNLVDESAHTFLVLSPTIIVTSLILLILIGWLIFRHVRKNNKLQTW